MASTPRPPPVDGSFDFELTDFLEARRALETPPEGLEIASQLRKTGGTWESRRRPKVASDRALLGATLDWLRSLPAAARPTRLVDEVPRLANALAAAWPDRATAVSFLEDLFVDRRGGRRGLPPDLREELDVLYALLTTQPTEPAPLAPTDPMPLGPTEPMPLPDD